MKLIPWRILIGLVLITSLSQCSNDQLADKPIENKSPRAIKVNQTSNKVPEYETVIAELVDEDQKITISGRLQSIEKVQIASEVPGRALKTNKILNEGVRYQKGETLVKIDKEQQILNLKAQKSQFQSALVRIMSQIQLDYPEDHLKWDAYLQSFDPSIDLPELPEVNNDQLKYFLAANNIFATYYNIKSAEIMLPKYTIKAPFQGVVIQGNVGLGTIVNPGVPLATYSRTDVYELKAAVSSADIYQLKPGQKLKLYHRNTGKKWTGTVHRLGSTIDPTTQSIPVFIRVSGSGLREGMFLETQIGSVSTEGVVILPLSALTRSNQVLMINDSTVISKPVERVHFEQDKVWVKGLAGGEKIITESIEVPIVGTKAAAKS